MKRVRISMVSVGRASALLLLAGVACFGQEAADAVSKGAEAADPLQNWRWINFVLLAIGLGYLLWKNLPVFFATRTAAIQKEISEAQRLKQEADRRAAEIERKVSGLGAEIEAFRQQSQAEMQREGERIRKETAEHIRKVNEQGQLEIDSAGKTVRREVRQYASDLALDLAEQRIRARLDANTEASLVDNFIGDLRKQESNN